MVLGNIRSKNCPICNRRADNIFRVKINESHQVSEFNRYFQQKKCEVSLNDIVCKKHLNDLRKNSEPESNDANIQNSHNCEQFDQSDSISFEVTQDDLTSSNSELRSDLDNNENSIIVDIPLTHSFCFICKIPSG